MHTHTDTEVRIALAQAADLARELGHHELGPGHLLAALLADSRGRARAALHDHGLDFRTARDLVAAHHVDGRDGRERRERPRPVATSAGDGHGYDDDRAALESIGIDLDRVREAVRRNLGADLADGWAARPERTRRRGAARRHEDQDAHEHHAGRGRRGPRSRRSGPRLSRAARAVLRDVPRTGRGERAPLTGPRLLVALLRSDDPAVRAVLAAATGPEGLRAEAEAASRDGVVG